MIGGYLLAGGVITAGSIWTRARPDNLRAGAIMSAAATPFLLLGTWASPGHDPSLKQLIPPDLPMPDLHFAFVSGVVNLLIFGGLGYGLRRWGLERARARRGRPDLEFSATSEFDR